MSSFAMRYLIVGLVCLAVLAGLTIVVSSRLNTIEHKQTIIERKLVEVPCANGNDAACRHFLALLLADATKAELRQLLDAKSIHIPASGLLPLLNAIRHPQQPRHHASGPIFGPPAPVTILPSPPRGVMPPGIPEPKVPKPSLPG